MTQRTLIATGILTVIAALAVTAFGWSSWASNAQRSRRQQAGAQNSKPSTQPDTRRDVLIAARRAPQAAEIGTGTWLNSYPLSLEKLRGKVVFVDFWTFGCYNCRNTLPTLKRFHADYGARGLTVVGVHSPESEREKIPANVRREVRRLGIAYPVVTDNEYATWRAYGVQAWPTVVILDKRGRVRYTHIGEGAYDVQEKIIKTLLAEEAGEDGKEAAAGERNAVFAGGCFWGVEAVFEHVRGVLHVESGYSGGTAETAHYDKVSAGRTAHAEAVRVTYDPSKVSYAQLLDVFFTVAHDPTELNRQGPDTGKQYRSAIFYADEEQRQAAEDYIKRANRAKAFKRPIVTQVVALEAFHEAEAYHQDYAARHPDQPYIVVNDLPKVEELRRRFPALYTQR